MCIANPMFHMDVNYDWRWFTISEAGRITSVSIGAFFSLEEARQDYRATHGQHFAALA